MARSELENQNDPSSNGIGNTSTEIVHQQGATSNGVPKAVVPPVATTSASMIPENVVTENGEAKMKTEKEN